MQALLSGPVPPDVDVADNKGMRPLRLAVEKGDHTLILGCFGRILFVTLGWLYRQLGTVPAGAGGGCRCEREGAKG